MHTSYTFHTATIDKGKERTVIRTPTQIYSKVQYALYFLFLSDKRINKIVFVELNHSYCYQQQDLILSRLKLIVEKVGRSSDASERKHYLPVGIFYLLRTDQLRLLRELNSHKAFFQVCI